MNRGNERGNIRKNEHKRLNKTKAIKISLSLFIVIVFVILFAVSLQIFKTTKTGVEVTKNLAESATETFEYSEDEQTEENAGEVEDEGAIDDDSEVSAISEETEVANTDDGVSAIADSSDYTITVTEYTGDTLEAEFDYENGRVMLYSIDSIDGSAFEQTGVEILTDTTYIGDYKKEQIGYITSLKLFCLNYSVWYSVAITSASFYNPSDYLSGDVEDYYIDGTDWTTTGSYGDAMWVYVYDGSGSNTLLCCRPYGAPSSAPYSYSIVAVINDKTPIEYSISFDSNGADDGEMEAISATYDEEYALTANTFTRAGYKFTGWNTEADGSGTSYEDEATVSNLTTEDGATVTLYAQWEEYTITVTEYTGDTIESEYDYENGTSLLYVVDGDTLEQLSVEDINGTKIVLKEYIEEEYEIEGYEISANLFTYLSFISDDDGYSISVTGFLSADNTYIFDTPRYVLSQIDSAEDPTRGFTRTKLRCGLLLLWGIG